MTARQNSGLNYMPIKYLVLSATILNTSELKIDQLYRTKVYLNVSLTCKSRSRSLFSSIVDYHIVIPLSDYGQKAHQIDSIRFTQQLS